MRRSVLTYEQAATTPRGIHTLIAEKILGSLVEQARSDDNRHNQLRAVVDASYGFKKNAYAVGVETRALLEHSPSRDKLKNNLRPIAAAGTRELFTIGFEMAVDTSAKKLSAIAQTLKDRFTTGINTLKEIWEEGDARTAENFSYAKPIAWTRAHTAATASLIAVAEVAIGYFAR
ncbi:MAG: hypothetical protein WCP97_06280 [bacterium]